MSHLGLPSTYDTRDEDSSEVTPKYLPEGVDISRYERELGVIHEQNKTREYKRSALGDSKKRLLEYRRQFEEEHRDDLVRSVDEDIGRIDTELASLA